MIGLRPTSVFVLSLIPVLNPSLAIEFAIPIAPDDGGGGGGCWFVKLPCLLFRLVPYFSFLLSVLSYLSS